MLRFFALAALLTSCGPDQAPSSRLRVVHAARGTPRLDVRVDDEQVARELAFGDTTPFLPLAPGPRSAQVTADGASLGSTPLELPRGQTLTLLMTSGENGSPRARLMTHDFAASTEGTSRLRLVHAGGGTEPFAVELGQATVALEAGGDTGHEGISVEANVPSSLRLTRGAAAWHFVLPALPAQSELLGLVLAEGERPALLLVAPSAVVGLIDAQRTP